MTCPRCQGTLQSGSFGEAPVHMCDGCASVLVAIQHNIPMLTQLGAGLTDADLQAPIDVHHTDEGVRPCPKCHAPMEPFPYMGVKAVTLDRCGPDRLLFLDVEEVTAAATLLIRTQRRVDERRAENEAHLQNMEETADLARVRMRGRMRMNFKILS